MSMEMFVEAAKRVHGDRYTYEHVDYKNAHTVVRIWCDTHGEFYQSPTLHLRGAGCPKCGYIARASSRRARSSWLSFGEARDIVRGMQLSAISAWNSWCKTSRPNNIPACPKITYKNEWRGWGDWLGNEIVWLPFGDAREIVRSFNLRSAEDWKFFCTELHSKPSNIPYDPKVIYADEWCGWGDWLGYSSRSNGELPGVVYIIQQSNLPHNVYKIGRTYRLDKRIYEHARCHGTVIDVVQTYDVSNMRIAEETAHQIAKMHGKQYQYRSHKEYFVLDDIDTVISDMSLLLG